MKYSCKHYKKAYSSKCYKDKIYNNFYNNNIRDKILNNRLKREDYTYKKVHKFMKLLANRKKITTNINK